MSLRIYRVNEDGIEKGNNTIYKKNLSQSSEIMRLFHSRINLVFSCIIMYKVEVKKS